MKLKNLIDYNRMQEFLNAPIDWFKQFGHAQQTPNGILIYKDKGASILSVAHLDSVNNHDHFYVNRFADNDCVFSTHLDDRLGAYVVVELLPLMGINADVLLTEGEEVGKSTAAHFTTSKQYKWMFSFDRRGTDVVRYRYDTPVWLKALNLIWKNNVFYGSNSDINYLNKLECCGVNVGTGYHNEHDLMCFANMTELRTQIGRFMQFYHTNKRISYPYIYVAPQPYKSPTYNYKPANPTQDYKPANPITATNQSTQPQSAEWSDEEWDAYDGYYGHSGNVPGTSSEDIPFNPYDGMHVDVPLDVIEYMNSQGVLVHPTRCAFCLEPLDKTHVFMGICCECEYLAVQCVVCHEYFCRLDDPSEDMGEELYFGICFTCTEQERFTNETTRFSNISNTEPRGKWNEDDDDSERDETNPTGGLA